jgi:chaperonin GroEL (HSP60 family)
MSDGAGKPPVVIVKEQTNITSGTDVQEKLIAASEVFANLLKPTFGPMGLDKMLYKTDGNTAVTNDGAKIVSELLVKHPAAKMLVSMCQSQEEACGDGVTTTMLLCGALLQEAQTLLRKGLHPLTIIGGYRKSMQTSLDMMDDIATPLNETRLRRVAETAMIGKGAEAALELLSGLVVDSLAKVSKNVENPGAEHVSMFKSGRGSLGDSSLITGVAFRRRIPMDGLPNNLQDAKVAVIGGDLKIRSMTRDAQIKIASADQLDSFVNAEQARKEQIATGILSTGADVILCGGEIDTEILHILADNEILAIAQLDESELRNAAEATSSSVIDSILDASADDLGVCGSLVWERNESTDMVEDIIRIDGCTSPSVVTIEVGGDGNEATEEAIRGIHDSLRATSLALKDDLVLPGGGSTHSRVSYHVRSEMESEPGRERIAMEAFARAMETIPAVLAENAGHSPLDRVLELRSEAMKESGTMGIDRKGEVSSIEDAWHPLSVISESLETATETAISMLRIDQVVSSRGD